MFNKSSLLSTCAVLVVALASQLSDAANVSIYFDNGSNVPGSTNTGSPGFNFGTAVFTWDVSSTAESGLSDIGAAVMEVRMTAMDSTATRAGMNNLGGLGLAVQGGNNTNWIDPGEAPVLELSFFSDVGKTNEITGLTIGVESYTARIASGVSLGTDFYAGSGSFQNVGTIRLGGVDLTQATDATNANVDSHSISYTPPSVSTDYYTASLGSGNFEFSEDDTIWMRRSGNARTFQLGALNLTVIPEPSTSAYSIVLGLAAGAFILIRRRRK